MPAPPGVDTSSGAGSSLAGAGSALPAPGGKGHAGHETSRGRDELDHDACRNAPHAGTITQVPGGAAASALGGAQRAGEGSQWSLVRVDSPNLSNAVRLRRLEALCLSSEDRMKNGFVMAPLTAAQILGK